MTYTKIMTIAAVFLLASAGWFHLGSVVERRALATDKKLKHKVEAQWGDILKQNAPRFFVKIPGSKKTRSVVPVSNKIECELNLEHRAKGLMWYPVYDCQFKAKYELTNSEKVTEKVRMHFSFPSSEATYDNFSMLVDDNLTKNLVDLENGIDEIIKIEPGQTRKVVISYKARGMFAWEYLPDRNIKEIKQLNVTVKTNFQDIDFVDGTLSPDKKNIAGNGYLLNWKADNLITSRAIGIVMPEKLNPGPLAGRITYFAPVCLLFFFVMIMAVNVICKVDIHPMHYLFVASGFFAFHLLFVYLVDLVNVHMAFAISAIVTIFLVSGYLRAALGKNFPWKFACAGQLFYLILFSYSFFLKGMTGLTVTIGSVLTLAVLMKVTAQTNWNEVFAKKAKKKPAPIEKAATL